MSTKYHYVFTHSSSDVNVRYDDTYFIVANYDTTSMDGMATTDLVTYYASALADNTQYNSPYLNDQNSNALLSAFPVGQFSDETTRGSANLNVIEILAESINGGTNFSTISELLAEVTTALTGTTVGTFATAISNITQTSTASTNLSVLTGTSGDYTPPDGYSDVDSPNESSSSGGSGQSQGLSWYLGGNTPNPQVTALLRSYQDTFLSTSGTENITRTNLNMVKDSLKTYSDESVKNTLAYLLSYVESVQKKERHEHGKRFKKYRKAILNTTQIEVLENNHRTGAV